MASSVKDEHRSPSMRPFFVIWSGQAVSLLGSQLVQFAIVWWLTRTTGSPIALTMASLAALLPQIVLGPFAGALVDRWNRRIILIAADTGIALATLLLAFLFWRNLASVWMIYALLGIRAAGAAFHWPAMTASTTLMVPQEHLARIAGLNQTLSGVANIFIPPLGALAIEALPMQSVLAIDVLTAIPAVVSLLFIAIPQPKRALAPEMAAETAVVTAVGKPSFWADMREGMRFVLNWRGLVLLAVIGILINMLGRAAATLMPLLVFQHFQGGPLELGWIQSSVGIGSLLGGILLGVWGGFRRRVMTQMVGMALDGLAVIVLGLTPHNGFWLAVVIVFVVGLLETIAIGVGGALFQAIVPPEMQGRVFGLLISFTQALSPLGLLVAGPTAQAFGVPFWFVLTGIVFVLIGAAGLFIPDVIHIEQRVSEHARTFQPVAVGEAKF